MNASDFDKFIKENSKGELEAPKALDWDKMNFDLPKPKKRRFGFIWLSLFLVGLIGSLVYFGGDDLDNKLTTSLGLSNAAKHTVEPNVVAKQTDQQQFTEAIQISNTPSHNNSIASKSTKENLGTQLVEAKGLKKNLSKSFKIAAEVNPNKGSRTLILDPVEVGKNRSNVKSTTDKVVQVEQALYKIGDLDIKNPAMLYYERVLPKLTLFNPSDARKKVRLPMAYFVGTGINYSNLKYSNAPQTNELNANVRPSIGAAFMLQSQIALKRNFHLLIGGNYQSHNEVFEYAQPLDPQYNFLERTKTSRYRYVVSKNVHHFLGLELGIAKKIRLTSKWEGILSSSLLGQYHLNSNGKLLSEQLEIVEFSNHQTQDRILLSSNAFIGFSRQFGDNALQVGFNWQRSLNKLQFGANTDLKLATEAYGLSLGFIKALR